MAGILRIICGVCGNASLPKTRRGKHNERVEKALDKKIKALEDETESAIKELNKLLSGDIKRKPLLADMDALKDISDKKKEITKLEQDKKNNNKDFEIENSSKDEANCAKCSSSKVEFENTDENDGKKFCSKDCCVNYYMEKYYSTDNNQKKCDKCNLSFDEYYTVGGKGRYCDDCAKKTIESYRKERKNPRPTVKSVAEGKRLIDEGKEINISGSPLTEAEKNELMDYDFRKRIALESESTRDDFPFKNALVVAGAIGITGTGKTAAFLIPVLEKLTVIFKPQVLILVPTRELALQVSEEARKLSPHDNLRVVAIYGGGGKDSYRRQFQDFRRGVDVIIGTPGRIIDHMFTQKSFSVTDLKFVVLDEVDEMISKGFLRDIEKIMKALESVIVFANTKRKVEEIKNTLLDNNLRVDYIHSDLSQNRRTRVFQKFRTKKISLLIATDVAARGLDIKDIAYVINYDFPQNNEFYIHRTGRTGRAGASGKAITFVNSSQEKKQLLAIARQRNFKLERTANSIIKKLEKVKSNQLTLKAITDKDKLHPLIEKKAWKSTLISEEKICYFKDLTEELIIQAISEGLLFGSHKTIDYKIISDTKEIQRFFLVLCSPQLGEKFHLLIIGKKQLPIEKEGSYFAFVEAIKQNKNELLHALNEKHYSTATRGERKLPVSRCLGAGKFLLVEHNNYTHFVYQLTSPKSIKPVQEEFNLQKEGDYLISVKNPKFGTFAGGTKPNEKPKLTYPSSLQEKFTDYRFIPLNFKEFLDYQGTELLLIPPKKENLVAREKEAEQCLEKITSDDLLEQFAKITSPEAIAPIED
ncbi:1488_t:CDS:10 [Funneliformis geosporum]|uniref:RNA helicase n=1 Tax=Funneliformis geosporum TaxID=1117311 RepID=A0A9W4SFR4_9GLOM|nr:1488_t:CDS:10 [Funneliformis geosporum]